jgi:hypothetical protein
VHSRDIYFIGSVPTNKIEKSERSVPISMKTKIKEAALKKDLRRQKQMKDISTDTVYLVVVAFSIRNVNIYCIFTAAIIEMDKPSFFLLFAKLSKKMVAKEREQELTKRQIEKEMITNNSESTFPLIFIEGTPKG